MCVDDPNSSTRSTPTTAWKDARPIIAPGVKHMSPLPDHDASAPGDVERRAVDHLARRYRAVKRRPEPVAPKKRSHYGPPRSRPLTPYLDASVVSISGRQSGRSQGPVKKTLPPRSTEKQRRGDRNSRDKLCGFTGAVGGKSKYPQHIQYVVDGRLAINGQTVGCCDPALADH